MKPSLFPVQISKILPVGPSFWGPQSAAPKPLPRLFLDPSYGPDINMKYLQSDNADLLITC